MVQWVVFLLLVGANALLWAVPVPSGMTVSFLDVGQGDSILIEGPTGIQVLVDAGPDGSALREVGARLPFWDRSLDAVVATHPDQDHIGGLADILERYDVAHIIEPGIGNTTRAWLTAVSAMEDEFNSGARHLVARSGTRIELGGGAYADVLFPNRDVTNIKDTNAGSIVLHVVYGATSFMLTGDLPSKEEQELFLKRGYGLDSDVLKAGHHGSKTSSSADFVQSVSPDYVVFSRGCDNRYGHPAPSVVAFFQTLSVATLDTCIDGTITFRTDGQVITNSP